MSMRFSRFEIRFSQARSSSSLRAFPSESICSGCSTCSNLASGAEPTTCVGESGVIRSGFSASIARSSFSSASYSSSPISAAFSS